MSPSSENHETPLPPADGESAPSPGTPGESVPLALRVGILVFGVFACSTAVIMIKACTIHPALLASYRLFVAAIVLTPLYILEKRRHRDADDQPPLRTTILPGLALGIHFITWIIGARLTPAANASLIVNLVPVAMPFFLIVLVGEKLTRREAGATGLALLGLLLLTAGDFHVSPEYFVGDVVCFFSMLFFTFYLTLARRYRRTVGIWLYVVPLYYVAAFFCLIVALPVVNPLKETYSSKDVLLVLGLGLIPTILGHSTLNYSLKHLRGQVVAIVNMGQFIFAGTMAFLLYSERPALSFIPASILLVLSGVLVVTAGRE